jgi:hypothetical protein
VSLAVVVNRVSLGGSDAATCLSTGISSEPKRKTWEPRGEVKYQREDAGSKGGRSWVTVRISDPMLVSMMLCALLYSSMKRVPKFRTDCQPECFPQLGHVNAR